VSRFFSRMASVFALSSIAVVCFGSASSGPLGAAPVALMARPATTFHTYLTSVSFANAADGWVAGGQRTTDGTEGTRGYIFRTTNSGRSWTRVITTHWVAHQMQFISGSRGWAVVASPANCDTTGPCSWAIVKTGNGGASWALQLNGGRCWEIQSLDFITSQEGAAVQSNSPCQSGNAKVKTRVMATADGGSTWRSVLQPGPRLTSVHFGTPLSGWAVADGLTGGASAHCRTTLYHKSQMGQTWLGQMTVSGYCDAYVDFVDARFGWLVATNVGACAEAGCIDNRLYRTTNGGNGWSIEKRRWTGAGCGFLQQPHFVSDTTGYLPVSSGVGNCSHGGVDITHDGGRHWVRKSPFGFDIGDVSPISSANVWAIGCPQHAGECSHLVHTTNGGASWTKIKIG
jgi:photosystem II stability/assembly factor-like uncharacterized protein